MAEFTDKEVEEIIAASKFVDTMLEQANAYKGQAPLWNEWALSEAFRAGVKWQEEREKAKV